MKCIFWFALAAAVLLTAPCAHPSTFFVNPEGTGDFVSIQDAIDGTVNGDTVLLADGTFTGDGNRDLDFGGRAITLRSLNGNTTICILDSQGSPGSPHRGFYFHSGEDSLSVVEGITVTGGYSEMGGGFYCVASSPKIIGCRIRDNVAVSKGGGVCYDSLASSTAVISGCRIVGNHSDGDGGGVSAENSNPKIVGSRILANTATWYGAGFYGSGGSEFFLDCVVAGNRAFNGGGIYVTESTPFIQNCTISGNWADNQGGGIACRASSTVKFEKCIVWGNCANAGFQAYLRNSTIIFSCCAVQQGGVQGIGEVGEINGSVSKDPIFCLPYGCADAPTEDGDYAVSANSPCLPLDSPCEEQIGILKLGCGPDTRVEPASWGSIKSLFRY
jgi:hypothetical protein